MVHLTNQSTNNCWGFAKTLVWMHFPMPTKFRIWPILLDYEIRIYFNDVHNWSKQNIMQLEICLLANNHDGGFIFFLQPFTTVSPWSSSFFTIRLLLICWSESIVSSFSTWCGSLWPGWWHRSMLKAPTHPGSAMIISINVKNIYKIDLVHMQK